LNKHIDKYKAAAQTSNQANLTKATATSAGGEKQHSALRLLWRIAFGRL
jgi:hypothetical protein